MSSWVIDPKTGDYVMQDGKPIPSESLLYPAYYRLKIGRNRWMYAPDANYGSDLANIKKRFNGRDLTGVAATALKAIMPIQEDGRALAVDVQPDTQQQALRNNVALHASITSADGTTETLDLPVVGG